MNKDFRYMVDPRQKGPRNLPRPRRHHILAGVLAAAAISIVLGIHPYDAAATREKSLAHTDTPAQPISQRLIEDTLPLPQADDDIARSTLPPPSEQGSQPELLPLPRPPSAASRSQDPIQTKQGAAPENSTLPEEHGGHWQEATVKPGDSMALIFSRNGFRPAQLHEIVSLGEEAASLKHIKPGQTIRIRSDEENRILELRHVISQTKSLQVLRKGDRLYTSTLEKSLEPRKVYTTGRITQSLYLAAKKAGMSDNLIMEMASIFGWDVDFALDIRKGDHFTVIYEEMFLDDKKVRDGRIIAAEFVNQDKVYQAVLFTDPNGNSNYYTPEGYSMRKAFLRSPVDFRRISSRFQRERWHPVLGKKRPHKGVDYAAATGTPIKAAGDGKITHLGRKGGYGRAIVLRHGSNITTLYGHMSSYQRGLHTGSRVKQGQVIGYVGQSGLATGPHLHYEFRVNGVHRNPLTVKLPQADPLPKQYRAQFKQLAQPLLAQLQLYKDSQLALQQ